jgi:hypothetical protein
VVGGHHGGYRQHLDYNARINGLDISASAAAPATNASLGRQALHATDPIASATISVIQNMFLEGGSAQHRDPTGQALSDTLNWQTFHPTSDTEIIRSIQQAMVEANFKTPKDQLASLWEKDTDWLEFLTDDLTFHPIKA